MVQSIQTTLPIGTIIRDRYIVEGLLGKGGFGAVYLVRDMRVRQNLFALKELYDPSKKERDRFTFVRKLLPLVLLAALLIGLGIAAGFLASTASHPAANSSTPTTPTTPTPVPSARPTPTTNPVPPLSGNNTTRW